MTWLLKFLTYKQFSPQNRCKTKDMVVCAYNLITRKMGTDKFLGLTSKQT